MNTRTRYPAFRSTGGTPAPHWLIALLLIALALPGCAGPPSPTPPAAQPSTPTQPPQPASATRAPTAVSSTETDALTLTWWTPEFLSPQAQQPVGPVLAEQLNAFSESQGGKVQVEAVRKARYGKGGLLDALRTAAPVAKEMLPDIVALDAVEVEKAVEAGLLQPLDGLLDPAVTEKLYPFASEAGQFGERLYAIQYLADLGHASYLPAQVAEPPANWTDLLGRRTAYLFPIAPPQSGSGQGLTARPAEGLSHAVLSQYLSAGATLTADRRLAVEGEPLLRLLSFYDEAAKAGVLLPTAREMADGEAVWSAFVQGQAPLAYVDARNFTARGDFPGEHAPAPGFAGPAVGLANGWTLAIVTTDPRRQRAAADLIAWLLQPENAGDWAARAGWLPTSTDALKALGDPGYASFLDSQLAQARSLPVGPESATTAARIQAAVEAVLGGQSDPATATEAALSGQ